MLRIAHCHGVSISYLPDCGLKVLRTPTTQCDAGTGKVHPQLVTENILLSLIATSYPEVSKLLFLIPRKRNVSFFISLIISLNSKLKRRN